MLQRIRDRVDEVMPQGLNRLKLRSSANAEDIPNFDGAGLYTSFSARLDRDDRPDGSCDIEEDNDGDLRMSPRTVNCALKGVYASLWNQRAVEERNFARLDHGTAAMGIAIVPRYAWQSPIAANSVAITRVLNTGAVSGYTFSTQEGNTLVTNPPAGTISEEMIAAFSEVDVPPAFIVTRYAVTAPNAPPRTESVLSQSEQEQLLEITKAVEEAYCHAQPDYYPGDCSWVTIDPGKPTALDLEYKLLDNGQFVCKQVREFSGGGAGDKSDALGSNTTSAAGCNAATSPSKRPSLVLVVLACLAAGRRKKGASSVTR